MVVEADESDGSFLKLSPAIAIVTNIDPEHLDHYGTLDKLKEAFVQFTNSVPFYGLAVMCLDHPNVQALLPLVEKRVITYGFAAQADYRADEVRLDGFMTRFHAWRHGMDLGEFAVRMVGRHNAQNALAAIAVAEEMGVALQTVHEALAGFGGVQRRFTVLGEEKGVTVIDDYGHHPEEVRATLKGAKQAFNRRVICAFQPHRYTRTHLLLDEFATAFNDADVLFVTEVYAASEEPIPNATGERVAEAIKACGHRDVTYVGSRSEVATAVRERVQPGDIVIMQGAGDINQSGHELLSLLKDGNKGT
jgi:UDP-N-acetylmuramate--alanine ligase